MIYFVSSSIILLLVLVTIATWYCLPDKYINGVKSQKYQLINKVTKIKSLLSRPFAILHKNQKKRWPIF